MLYDLSIIIVTYNSANDIIPCLESIASTKGSLNLEILIVDNASKDATREIITEKYPDVTLISNATNAGFPGANNQAIKIAQGKYILLLNPDTVVKDGALELMVRFMHDHPNCAICAPTLIDRHGQEYPNLRKPSISLALAALFQLKFLVAPRVDARKLAVLSGACLLFPASLPNEIGLLDARMHTCEDLDFCLRAKNRGYEICQVHEAQVLHLEGQSAKTNIGYVLGKQYESKIRFNRRHLSHIENALLFHIYRTEILFRILKWSSQHQSADRTVLLQTLRTLQRRLPEFYRRELVNNAVEN